MKFGMSFIILLLVGMTFVLSSCITTRSPAVELFESFKEHIQEGQIDVAYDMLAAESRPDKADFIKGIEGEWKEWFSKKGQLHTPRPVQGNSNHLTGDLVISGEAKLTQKGGFEVFRKDANSEWKINWKLGSGVEAAPSATTAAEVN